MTSNDQTVEADIRFLEQGILRLKRQYDMFFAGALDREPVELRLELERVIRRHRGGSFNKYAQRFQFNAIVSRFNTYAELWGKRTRSFEQGEQRHNGAEMNARERLVARCRIDESGDAGDDDLRRLHRQYVETSQRLAPNRRSVPFEKFVRGVTAQTERLRRETGCGHIEVRLTVRDDRLELKARPGR